MLVFIPQYNEDTVAFRTSLDKQTIPFRTYRRDRKKDRIYWTKALNDFYKYCQNQRYYFDEVICIMNNDISFGEGFLEEGSKVKDGEVYIPKSEAISVDWSKKRFYHGDNVDCFSGRAFFMTYNDFINSGGFCKLLPHYGSDYEFGIRQLKRLKPVIMDSEITHLPHSKKEGYSILSPNNPIFWTIFLLKHPNRYAFINILKAWYDAIGNPIFGKRLKSLETKCT